jgi:hypothetical protein
MTEKDKDDKTPKDLESSEDNLKESLKSSEEVRSYFREALVPAAIETYLFLLADEDPKIRKDAADSVMKIEGSLGGKEAGNNSGITFNFDMSQMAGMAEALKSVGSANTREITDE